MSVLEVQACFWAFLAYDEDGSGVYGHLAYIYSYGILDMAQKHACTRMTKMAPVCMDMRVDLCVDI